MKKILLMVLVVVGSIFMVIGGIKMNKVHQQNELIEMAHSKEVRRIIEKRLAELDPNVFTSSGVIKKYRIRDDDVEKNPMGGIIIYLTINDSLEYRMTFFIDKDSQTGELVYTGGSRSPELQQLLESEGLGQ